jgi:transcriptional regulator with XRE-family HTH domain
MCCSISWIKYYSVCFINDLARIRRGITQKDLAARAQMSPLRLRKVETGEPTVGLGAIAQVLDVLGLVGSLAQVAGPENDSLGKSLENKNRKKRVDPPRNKIQDLDF